MSLQDDYKNLTDELLTLLDQLEIDLNNKSAALDTGVFQKGCKLVNDLVELLEKNGSGLDILESEVAEFDINIPDEKFDRFLQRETRFLQQLKLNPKHIMKVIEALGSTDRDARPYRLNGKEVLKYLRELRELFSQIDDLTRNKKWKISKDLVMACAGGGWQVVVIAGDVAGFIVGTTTFAAGALIAAGSIGEGLRGLVKKISKIKGLYSEEVARYQHSILKTKKGTFRIKKRDSK